MPAYLLAALSTLFFSSCWAAAIPQASFDFEQGNLSGWNLKRLSNPAAAKILTTPVRAGRYAAAVTLRNGETYGDSWKSELSDPYYAPFKKEIWYRVSHYLPESFIPEKGNSCTIAQWHNTSAEGAIAGAPPLDHQYEDGILKISISYTLTNLVDAKAIVKKILFRIPFKKGEWHDFVYRIVWSKENNGEIEAWYNGKYLGSYKGPLGYPSDVAGPYFKTGVYCPRSPVNPLTAYVDEYHRGPSRSSVLLRDETIEQGR